MEFYTKYNRPKRVGEINDGISEVETSGYIPAKQRIENLLIAGKRLNEYREDAYDIKHGEKIDLDIQVDPTRNGIDIAEASELLREAENRILMAKTEASQVLTVEKGNEAPEGDSTSENETSNVSEDS